MTLIFGLIIGFVSGRTIGRRWPAYLVIGLVWYAALAVQTAYLAHPGRKGFFGVDGLRAVQGHGLAQYWMSQVLILGLIVVMFLLGDKLRSRVHQSRQ